MVYGKQKVSYGIDGIELLEKAEWLAPGSLALTRVLNDEDLRKIRLLKLKNAIKHVTKEKMPGQEGESGEDQGSEDDEEGEIELDEEDAEEDMEEELEDDDEEAEASDEESEDSESESEEVASEEEEKSDDLEDLDSEELEGSSEEDNPHGFVYSHHLDTFKRSKRERLAEQLKDKEVNRAEHKQQFKKRDKKRGGKTNQQNLKNKPFNMVKPKKLDSIHDRFQTTKSKLKSLHVQLGKYKKTQKSKIESRRKRFKQR